MKLYHAAKLLRLLDIYAPSVDNSFKTALKKAVYDCDSDAVQNATDDILDVILARTGLNFYGTKSACVEAIFSMFEMVYEHTGKEVELENNLFQFQNLAEAETIADLRQCLLSAGADVLNLLFKTATLKHNTAIRQALDYINLHYAEKINQNQVSNAVFLSPSYFSKIFKDITGHTFSSYLNHIRINKAKELLSSPFIPIDSVFKAVGFESRSYFGKIFRRLTGTTPKRYRDTFCKDSKV